MDRRATSQHILSQREPTELLRRWHRDRDRSARDQLFERFSPLARSLARRYTRAGEPFDDVFQVASCGLLKALDRFDPDRGTAFSSFAVPTIVGDIKRYYRDLGWSVHVPRSAQELARTVQRAEEAVTAATGRSPSLYELAQYAELSIEDVLEGVEAAAAHHSTSFDAPREDSARDARTLADTLAAEDTALERAEARATIASAVESLSVRERHALALRFVRDLTQSEIAREMGVSQMQVSRILRGALLKLSELSDSEPPESPADCA
jgi:RNA polymerase sigma-B factor